jgi:hypothetical protein
MLVSAAKTTVERICLSGNANLPIGGLRDAIREIGVPGRNSLHREDQNFRASRSVRRHGHEILI